MVDVTSADFRTAGSNIGTTSGDLDSGTNGELFAQVLDGQPAHFTEGNSTDRYEDFRQGRSFPDPDNDFIKFTVGDTEFEIVPKFGGSVGIIDWINLTANGSGALQYEYDPFVLGDTPLAWSFDDKPLFPSQGHIIKVAGVPIVLVPSSIENNDNGSRTVKFYMLPATHTGGGDFSSGGLISIDAKAVATNWLGGGVEVTVQPDGQVTQFDITVADAIFVQGRAGIGINLPRDAKAQGVSGPYLALGAGVTLQMSDANFSSGESGLSVDPNKGTEGVTNFVVDNLEGLASIGFFRSEESDLNNETGKLIPNVWDIIESQNQPNEFIDEPGYDTSSNSIPIQDPGNR